MYKNVKSCISINNVKSDYFMCNVGVRQGENLSPFLFALYINDLEDFLSSNNCVGLSIENSEINVYLKLLILLYADDTVILAESSDDLQQSLNHLQEYCKIWKLTVNKIKTKICIFSKRKVR